jgi:hypothetical protein
LYLEYSLCFHYDSGYGGIGRPFNDETIPAVCQANQFEFIFSFRTGIEVSLHLPEAHIQLIIK